MTGLPNVGHDIASNVRTSKEDVPQSQFLWTQATIHTRHSSALCHNIEHYNWSMKNMWEKRGSRCEGSRPKYVVTVSTTDMQMGGTVFLPDCEIQCGEDDGVHKHKERVYTNSAPGRRPPAWPTHSPTVRPTIIQTKNTDAHPPHLPRHTNTQRVSPQGLTSARSERAKMGARRTTMVGHRRLP